MLTRTDVQAALELIGQLDPLWPGFEPANIALVVWDGLQTTLFQSGTAPSSTWEATPQGWTLRFRHPALVANTAVTLEGGVMAAAVLLGSLPENTTVLDLAALIVHEAFHVYQSTHRPERWQADELAVFGFPLTAPVLAARRLETLALRLALEDEAGWKGHAAEALHWREQRWTHLTAAQQELERGLERLEGLAHFAELKVSGRLRLPPPDFLPAQIRQRCYATGAALASLLDHTGDWTAGFMSSSLSLDELLSERLEAHRTALAPELVMDAERSAALDAQNVEQEKTLGRQAYLNRSGPRLTLTSARPFWPQGFDPLNITDLGGGLVLHTRFLRFGNAQVSGELLGTAALTSGVGAHPLMNGFSSVILAGLDTLRIWSDENTLHVQAQGVELQITGASRTEESSEGWTIALP